MKLTELQPQFLRFVEDNVGRKEFHHVDSIDLAQGISFLCPKCFVENRGARGTHAVICWSRSRGVPDHVRPAPGRWTLVGTGYHDLTLNGDPPGAARSVLLTSGCAAHFFVTNGEVA